MPCEIWVPKRRRSDVREEEVDAPGTRGFTFEARLRAEPQRGGNGRRRVIDEKSPIAKRLTCGTEFIELRRQLDCGSAVSVR